MTPEPEWVDLGLPSGLLWRRFNLGATKPESAGLYFSWGNIEGHPAGAGYEFSQEVYNTTPGAAITEDLSLSQDAARIYLGTPWRMPSAAEFQELLNNCAHIWTTLNGMNGLLLTSNANGKTLFLPAAGDGVGTSINNRGVFGLYWTSTFFSAPNARYMYFNNSEVNAESSNQRRYGFAVRAVKDGTPNRSIVSPTTENEPKEEETPTTEEPKDDNQR